MAAPVFVQIKNVGDVVDITESIKSKLISSRDLLYELYNLRDEEDALIASAKSELSAIDDRLQYLLEVLS